MMKPSIRNVLTLAVVAVASLVATSCTVSEQPAGAAQSSGASSPVQVGKTYRFGVASLEFSGAVTAVNGCWATLVPDEKTRQLYRNAYGRPLAEGQLTMNLCSVFYLQDV